MDYRLPGLILTGASGFVGRNFIKAAADSFRLFCVGRRSMEEAGVQACRNLRWTQVDIADWHNLRDLVQRVRDHGGIDYVLHLAGYYDFTNQDHPEYSRTNVQGTRNMLEVARQLAPRRFIFASSQAACPFGAVVNEQSEPSADMPYARSKRAGEELVREYGQWFPCAIVRIAAVFSDWCEYPPLYTLLNNWLSGKLLDSRILAGHGRSAIPYIHVHDLVLFFLQVLERSEQLDPLVVLNAGPDGAVSHLELYQIATRSFYGRLHRPLFVPRWMLAPMIVVRRLIRHLQGREPFEQLWMLDYVDKELRADSAQTRRLLAWEPNARRTITRRLVFLIENMQRNPELWQTWNEAMLRKAGHRPDLLLDQTIATLLQGKREEFVAEISRQLTEGPVQCGAGRAAEVVRSLRPPVLQAYLRLLCQLIVTVIRTKNRPMMRQFALVISAPAMEDGFSKAMESHCLYCTGELLISHLRSLQELIGHSSGSEEQIPVIIHMAIDQIEDHAELSRAQHPRPEEEGDTPTLPDDGSHLDEVVIQLEELCNEAVAGHSWSSPLFMQWTNS